MERERAERMTSAGASTDASSHEDPRKPRSALWQVVPLALVGLALLGSVAIPARQTWLITQSLRETTEVIAPARLLVEQLQADLAKELTALQSYALSGDRAMLSSYHTMAGDDERRVTALELLAVHLDEPTEARARALRVRIGRWRRLNDALIERSATRAELTAALADGQTWYDSSVSAIAELSSGLAAEAAARDERVRALEHLSIAANAGLVLAAIVAMSGVILLSLRERKLATVLQAALEEARVRARQEAALREAAEALAGAYTMDEVTQRIAHAALQAMQGRGAFVAQIITRADEAPEVVVKSVMGTDVLPVGARRAFAGSYTERVTGSGEPLLVDGFMAPEPGGSFGNVPYPDGSAIVLPLNDGSAPIGALFVLSSVKSPFRPSSVAQAEIFAHLATLAYEKVRLLEEADERRRALERAVQSRSRLMRGFSHDVKNPMGAADGFAELLALGIYGALTDAQQASIERMRRSIQAALALIDDLHELSRAETGIVTLTPEPVDLAVLARALGEEYHAAATASGLSLSVRVESDDTVVETDRARVRQIASNLLSNAIKYTDSGTVEVRVRREAESASSQEGEERAWALLEIVDSGIGIAEDKQGYIFEEFSRLNSGDRSGAGLGLAISKLLAQALGGRISVQSKVGSGSTFTLWLPLRRPAGTA